jgi:pimeloyl-ACP methyl ester carboxylesterase
VSVTRSTAATDGVDQFIDVPAGPRICFRVDGPSDGEPVLLLAGLGLDLTSWPQQLVDGYVDRGFRVVRPDNRDAGRSDRIAARSPGLLRQMLARPRPDAYDLTDMAADTIGVLDHLDIERPHLVGMSMGGMIAQTMAARHPARAASLMSIFSTTGHARVGRPAASTLVRMARGPVATVEESVARHLSMLEHLAGPGFPHDHVAERAWATGLWERAGGRTATSGIPRQIDAIRASGDRTSALRAITAPTLVVHGDRDRMVHPSGGLATARAVAGARHVVIPGMGHHIAPGVLDQLLELSTDHARSAGTTRSARSADIADVARRSAGPTTMESSR